jgi:hypothetical protein
LMAVSGRASKEVTCPYFPNNLCTLCMQNCERTCLHVFWMSQMNWKLWDVNICCWLASSYLLEGSCQEKSSLCIFQKDLDVMYWWLLVGVPSGKSLVHISQTISVHSACEIVNARVFMFSEYHRWIENCKI